MGTIVKPCDAYIHMLEVRKSLISKIKELHDSGIFIECDPLFILKKLNYELFCKVIYDSICHVILERNRENVSSEYLVANVVVIDALCKYITGKCPGFETSGYLYKVNILGTVLEVIQDIPRPNHNRYSFLILR